MNIKFFTRIDEQNTCLFIVARGDDRPNVVAEIAAFLESEGLYITSIGFNLISPDHDQFSLEIVAKGSGRSLSKCALALETDTPLPQSTSCRVWPRVRWHRSSFFHISLTTPDRAGLVAAIARAVGHSDPREVNALRPIGSFVHLIGAIDSSGESAQGSTPYFKLRANVATETASDRDAIILRLKETAHKQGFSQDIFLAALE